MIKRLLFLVLPIVCLFNLQAFAAAPANDNPCSATALTIGAAGVCTYTTYTNASATATAGVPAPGCSSYLGADVWFSVTVPAGVTSLIFDSQTGVMTDGGMAFYSGACGSLALVGCDDDGSANGLMPAMTVTGLTPGSVYYVRFWEYGNDNNGTFGLCCSQPAAGPTNDDPCGATVLATQAAGSCAYSTYTTAGSTATAGVPAPGCSSLGKDVWFKVTVPAGSSGLIIDTQTGVMTDGGMAIYSGACGALTLLSCDDDASANGLMPYLNVGGLTAGTSYYVRMWGYGTTHDGTFGICVTTPPPPPANDEPCSAINLTVGAIGVCNHTTGTNVGATGTTGVTAPGCGSYLGGDVWYKFTVPASGNFHFDSFAGATLLDADVALYTGTCGALTLLACDDASGAGSMPMLENSTVAAGQTVWVRIWEYGNDVSGTFDVCVSEIAPPPAMPACGGNPAAGNTCATATPICEFNGYCGNTSATYTADAWAQLLTAFCGTVENDSYLSFTASATTVALNIWVTTSASGFGIQMMFFKDDNCGGALDETHECLQFDPGGPYTFTGTGLTIGQKYLLMIDGYAGDVCNYVIQAATGVSIPVTAAGAATICGGQTVALSATGGNGTYSWQTGATSLGTAASINVAPTTTTIYTVTSATGNPLCPSSAADYVTVTVNNPATITAADQAICSGGSATVTTSVTAAGGTYSWAGGLGAASSITVSPGTTTDYTVYYTKAGCVSSDIATVTVGTTPTVTINANTLCAGSSNTFTPTVNPAGGTYSWAPTGTTASTLTVTPASSTTYTVFYTNGGCSANDTARITVNAIPTATFTQSANQCLTGNTFTFTNTGTSGGSATYNWNFGGGGASPATSTTNNQAGVTYTTAGTYTITHTVTNLGCSTTVTNPVTIYPMPTITGTLTACVGATTTLTGSATAAAVNPWVSATPAVATVSSAGVVTGVSGGTSVITYTNTNGCTITATVTINPLPTITGTLNACIGGTTTLTGSATAAAVNPWVSATPAVATVSSGGVVTGVSAGTSVITYTNTNGCVVTATVTINALPTITGTLTVCAGLTTTLTGSATAAAVNPWVSATPAVATVSAAGVVTGVSAGTSVITYTNTNGCTKTATVTVNAAPTITGTLTACVGATTTLTGSATAAAVNPWVSASTGVATITSAGVVTGVSAGTSVITYTNTNGCTVTATVTINALPTITGTLNACIGSTTTLTGSATAAVVNPWVSATPAVATVSSTGVVTGVSAGTSVITYTNTNGCVVTATVTINALPTITGTLTVCAGLTTALTGSATAAAVNPWVSATPAVATVSSAGVVTGVSAGTSVITYTNTNGCIKTATVTVNALPTITGTLTACVGATTALTGSATAAAVNPWVSATPAVATVSAAGVVTGVSAGTSVITYTNTNGCIVTATVTITALPTITGTLTACVGATTTLTGSATAAAVNPWVSATPAVATVSSAGVVTGVSAGTSLITYTNTNGCTVTATVTINAAPTITGTLTACVGATTTLTGSATAAAVNPWVSASTGVATITSAGVVTGVSGGTSVITYTNTNGCTITATVTINALPTITGTLSACVGATTSLTGSASAAAVNPWVSATPAVATVSSTGVVTAVSAGTSVITYTNTNGCVKTATVTVNALPTITGTLTACVGATTTLTGSATPAAVNPWVSASTGVATITSGGVVTGVSAGTSVITYTNTNGCTITATVTINALPTITGTLNACVGATTALTGSATAAAVNPWVSSNSAIATVSSTGVVTGVAAGSAVITYTNTNGCVITATVTINPLPTATTSTTNSTCGTANGTATVVVGAGTPAFTYAWSPSGGTGTTANALAAGGYTVTVTDSKGCVKTATANVTDAAAPTATITASTNINCNGGSTGSATVTAAGGAGGFTYTWNSTPVQNTATATGLPAGAYSVSVKDANGCIVSTSVTLTQPAALTASITASTNVLCNAATTGAATSAGAGGTPGYTYLWSPSGGTGASATGLAANTYTVTITDTKGCTANTSIIITQPTALTASATPTAAGCNGAATGSVALVVGGGTTTYTYLWSNGATTQNLTNVAAAVYNVTVTDANGCTKTATATVTQPTALTATNTTVNSTCGASNGTATAVPAGGTPGYTYAWAPSGGTAITAAGLAAGSYTVTVTDTKGCITTSIANVTDAAAPTASIGAPTMVSCNGGTNGAATVTGSGGVTPYTYTWNSTPNQFTATATGLPAGTYTATVKDNNGCLATANVTITEPTLLVASISASTNVLCNAATTGAATAAGSGGTPGYTYAWAPSGGTGASATGLAANTYTVTITDTKGCSKTATTIITQPTALTATATPTAAGCNGAATGSVALLVGGGTAGYTYLWSNGATTQNLTNVVAGVYNVTVTDANGCTKTATATVTQPTALTASNTTTNSTCSSSNGTATVTGAGGAGAYTYAWTTAPVQTTAIATGLAAGSYTATVTDAAGCTASTVANVVDALAPSASISTSTNVSCNAGTNGAATVVGSGGTGAYTYAWNTTPVQTTATATGLAAGTYSVNVKDGNNCIANATIIITEPSALLANISSSTMAACNLGTTGAATVLATGGTAGYNYSWAPSGGTGATATGLAANTYTVTVTDAKGCIKTASIVITEPTAIVATATPSPVLCNGGTTGSVALAVSGGTAGYTYSWSNGATSQNLAGVAAGTYTATVTDANGCIKVAAGAVVTQPTALTASATTTNSTCGASNGTATVTANNGTSGYTYTWTTTPVQYTAVAAGLPAASYTATVVDANGCTTTAVANVTDASAPTASISTSTNVSCNAGTNGAATVVGSGGTGAYTYAWNTTPVQTTATATGLAAGTYSVNVKDGNNCIANATIIITEPSALLANISSSTMAACNLGTTGAATVLATGGTAGYNYSWAPSGGTGATATGLAANTYTVTVTDAKGCIKTASIVITEPTAIVATATPSPVLCNGGTTGSVALAVSGGTAGYTYSWSNGATSQNLAGVAAGTYTATVTDANGCIKVAAGAVVTQPTALTASATTTNSTCGASNGTATVTANNGTSGYTYTWTTTPVQYTAVAAGLPAASYTATVVDANGCTTTAVANVTDASAPTASISTSTNVSCNAGTNGAATVLGTGGATPYTYTWSTTPVQNTAVATGLIAGTYTATVKDNNGCIATTSVVITEPTLLQATISSSTMVACNLGTTGAATVTASNGTAAYTYSWSPSGGTGATATGLAANTYTVTVTDAKGCTKAASIVITEPTAIVATATPSPVLCNGGTTGSVALAVSGGTAGYTYSWSNGATSQNLAGVAAGTYTATVTDANGCIKVAAGAVVTQPTALIASATTTNSTCGASNGTATVTASNGTAGYTYSWTSGGAGTLESGLPAGSYTATVTDANGCTTTALANVVDNSAPSSSITAFTNVSCNGGSNGTATITGVGGAAPYTYTWNTAPTQNTATATGLAVGSYTATIKDNNGCTTTATATITEPTVLQATISASTMVSCNAGTNGSATVTATNGTAGYTYSWSPSGGTAATATGLAANVYTVTVIDAKGCVKTTNVTITEPTAITASTSTTDALCNGSTDGTVTLSASGGTGTYTYSWDNGATSQNLTGVAAATYTATITDANGCFITTPGIVGEPATLSASTVVTDVSCNGGASGSIDLSVNGGTRPYTYSWSNVTTNEDPTSLAIGTYTVTITDDNNCSFNTSATVAEPTALVVTTSATDIYCGATNGTTTANPVGGTAPYTYSWDSSPSQSTQTATGLAAGTYFVTVKDAKNCVLAVSATVGNLAGGSASISTFTNASCPTICDGKATVTMTGGTTPFVYSWNNGATTAALTGLCSGTYSVQIVDSNNCTASASITLIDGTPVTVSLTKTDVLCFGNSTGAVASAVAGGTAPMSYSWSNAATTANLNGVVAGTYTVTATDPNGCKGNASITVTEPPIVVATSTNTNVSCFGGNNGTVTVTASGGVSPYGYAWTPNVSATVAASTLVAGNYSVVVTDANGCSKTTASVVTEPTTMLASLTTTNSNCIAPDGTVTSTISGGTSPYTYSWSNGATTANLGAVTTGNYSVTATDALGCTVSASAIVNSNGGGTAVLNYAQDVSCNGSSDGVVDVNVVGGNAPFTYVWATGQTTDSIVGLTAGEYTVAITDNKGCTYTIGHIINEPAALQSITTAVGTSCFGSCDGSAIAQVTGGTAPYSYVWNDPLSQTTATANNLCTNTYNVDVTDNNGCTLQQSVLVYEPVPLAATATSTPAGCAVNNGSATVVVTGGLAPYTYIWDSGSTADVANGISGGAHAVDIADANGCPLTYPVFVSTTNAPNVTITISNNALCAGTSTGVMTVAATGGVSPYTYTWSNGQFGLTATNVGAGVYFVNATDANGCVGGDTATVTEPSPMISNINITDPLCNSSCDGTATAFVVGGTSPYTYLWNDAASQTNSGAVNLCSGTYSVTITDANACPLVDNVTLSDPPFLVAVVSTVNTKCESSCDGSASVNVSLGTAPYTYVWNDPSAQTNANAVGLCSRLYTVTVTDANGCVASSQGTVGNASPLTAISTFHQDASCYGQCNGIAQVAGLGGTPPFSYLWSDAASQATSTASGLCAGSYTVTVSDSNNCTTTFNATIAQPALLVSSITKTNVTCFNACDGTATLTTSGGTAPYHYIWNPGFSTSSAVSNMCAGTYNVTITDTNNCIVVSSVNITQPSEIIVTQSNVVNSNCGQSNGSGCVSITGGVGAFNYSWSAGGSTSSCAANIPAGSYTVVVSDGSGCSGSGVVNLNDINGPTVNVVASSDVTCSGLNDGTASASINGGVSPYSVSWNDPANTSSTNVNGLDGGSYSITVTDNAGCVGVASVVIKEETAVAAGVIASTPVSCIGTCDGTAQMAASGGVGPYTYTWNTATPEYSEYGTNLCAGNLTLTATDSKGCPVTINTTIQQPAPLLFVPSVTNVSCFGKSDASIILSTSGGTPIYTYNWNPAISNNQTATNLVAGSYYAVITDSHNCLYSQTIVITEPTALAYTSTDVAANCNLANGSATLTVTGGTNPFNYQWNPSGQNTASATNLAPGNYIVNVTDFNGCGITANVLVNDLPKPSVTVTTNDVLCNGDATGTATANVTGGVSPFTYSWTPSGQTGANISGLSAGTHTVFVIDNVGCTINNVGVISQPTPLQLSVSGATQICNGQSASVYAAAGGGTQPYQYNWAPGGGNNSTLTITPATTTTYTVVLVDDKGCMATPKTVTVDVLAPLAVVITGKDSLCLGSSATLTANATGGNPSAYTYTWSPIAGSSSTLTVTPAATTTFSYTVDLNDGCSTPASATSTIVVSNNPIVSAYADVRKGCPPLSVSFESSTSLPVNYNWDFGDSANAVTANGTHTYHDSGHYDVSLIATTAEGCFAKILNIGYVVVYPLPEADFAYAPTTELTNVNSHISFVDQSENTVSWYWNFDEPKDSAHNYSYEQNPQHTYSDTGQYCVTLVTTSDHGCKDTTLKCFVLAPGYSIYIPNAFTPNGEGTVLNETFRPMGVGISTEEYDFQVFDRWGNLIFQSPEIERGWDGRVHGAGAICQNDVYVYKLHCKDILGNYHKFTGTVALVK